MLSRPLRPGGTMTRASLLATPWYTMAAYVAKRTSLGNSFPGYLVSDVYHRSSPPSESSCVVAHALIIAKPAFIEPNVLTRIAFVICLVLTISIHQVLIVADCGPLGRRHCSVFARGGACRSRDRHGSHQQRPGANACPATPTAGRL
jgi:hypothetical protein